MANDPRADIVIDPTRFFVPEDVIDVRAGVSNADAEMPVEENYSGDISNDIDVFEEAQEVSVGTPTDATNTIDVPFGLQIVSQTVRVAPDGRSVVDVTLSVEEVMGASDYELRVTK